MRSPCMYNEVRSRIFEEIEIRTMSITMLTVSCEKSQDENKNNSNKLNLPAWMLSIAKSAVSCV